MDEAALIYTTWPDAETAQAAAREAVGSGLAACANIFAPHLAIYRWDGAVEEGGETAVLFKTGAGRALELRRWIELRHPYDLPAILELQAGAASSPAYVAWLAAASVPPQAAGSSAPEMHRPMPDPTQDPR